jgi:hypothetical protein
LTVAVAAAGIVVSGAFSAESVPIDVRRAHTYSVVWAPDYVAFYVDDRPIKVVHQLPSYPMQFMLSIYDFRDRPGAPIDRGRYPKVFAVEAFRGYRPRVSQAEKPPGVAGPVRSTE